MTTIKNIIIIYNPNSTGDGKKNAESLQQSIAAISDMPVTLQPTDFAGHAEKIVQQLDNSAGTIIISSSGDGGYHDVINGILSHGERSNRLIAGLLPSGNANDHYHAVHHGDVATRIKNGDVRSMDVLKITVDDWSRYAHSYAGIGLTPHIGEKLTEATITPFNEAWLVIKYFFTSRPVKIRVGATTRRYDSLVFSNIKGMSKYMTLSNDARINDGRFEVTGKKAGSFGNLIAHLFKASTIGLTGEAKSVADYHFTSLRPFALQLDGEVFHFKADSKVTVSVAAKALHYII
ncbi:MAG TPA: diacylglycerol kinase family protein [Candidatus Saccharimonadales bacterium]|nr:diacylglycerol kinase family protein [Candidatus Saccharimonadales bacterium]